MSQFRPITRGPRDLSDVGTNAVSFPRSGSVRWPDGFTSGPHPFDRTAGVINFTPADGAPTEVMPMSRVYFTVNFHGVNLQVFPSDYPGMTVRFD